MTDRAHELITNSWSGGTRRRCESNLVKWRKYCINKGLNWTVTGIEHVVNFLAGLRDDGLGYSAINTARSALSAEVALSDGGDNWFTPPSSTFNERSFQGSSY